MNQANSRIETWKVKDAKDVSSSIARDLMKRVGAGKTLVIAERPVIVLSTIRKNWARLKREIEVDRARTLNKMRREEFDMQVIRMEWAEFTATALDHFADVYVVEVLKANILADQVATIYIAAPLRDSEVVELVRNLEPQVVVVRYVVDRSASRHVGSPGR